MFFSRPIASAATRAHRPLGLITRALPLHFATRTSPSFSAYPHHFIHTNEGEEHDPISLHDRGINPSPATLSLLASKNIRPYFYFIDIHGQVFLQDTAPKNFTSCYKDPKFLNFFLKRIRPNTTGYLGEEYHWQSPCAKEINFVEAADTPIVFHGLIDNEQLVWAGNLQTPFQPDKLSVSLSTGRIYHPLPSVMVSACSSDKDGNPLPPLGLLKSSLVLTEFANLLDHDSFTWQGKQFPIHHVP